MAKVIQTLRTHWKKSIFFSGLAVYGANYGKRKYEENQLMRQLCLEASKFGEKLIPTAQTRPYHVTVILNPAAHAGKARSRFENYCAPLLYLAGIKVSVIRTEGQSQAQDIMKVMENTDAVLVAGGDGTLMESVSGLLQREDANKIVKTLPLGILPVGFNNKMAHLLYPGCDAQEVALMAQAAMSVIKQLWKPVDVLEVRNLEAEKSLFGLRQVQVGAFTDAHQRMDKYWFMAGLKKYVTYIWAYTTSYSSTLHALPSSIQVGKVLEETIEVEEVKKSWFGLSSEPVKTTKILTKTEFDDLENDFNGCELTIDKAENDLKLSLAPEHLSFSEFVQEGWRRAGLRDPKVPEEWFKSKSQSFIWTPSKSLYNEDEGEKFFYLDNESVDIRGPIQVNLLKDKIIMFCDSNQAQEIRHSEEEKVVKKWWQKSSLIKKSV